MRWGEGIIHNIRCHKLYKNQYKFNVQQLQSEIARLAKDE